MFVGVEDDAVGCKRGWGRRRRRGKVGMRVGEEGGMREGGNRV